MWMKCINVVMCIDKKKLRTHQNTKKQSNWMQLLKMENDKLPKEICTYKIKKFFFRRNLFYTALP